ncbi:MAG TPA: hypothetical protein PKI71_16405 [Candidatus Rifleibacterium sp.]|nr:hypothetical protein [Candidatus Rifleibacterium sp.]
MENTQSSTRPALTSRKKIFLGFKIAFLGLLNFLAHLAYIATSETFSGMNVELSAATRVSLMLVGSKTLLVLLIVGSGILIINETKNSNQMQKENLEFITFWGLVLMHIATIFFMIHAIIRLMNV